LWLSGEGYGGIFVPWLARGLDAYIKQAAQGVWVPKLKGIVVGNGFTDFKYDGLPAFVTMAHYHGLIDDELYDFISGSCNLSYVNVKGIGSLPEACLNAMQTFDYYTSYANNFDIYGYCYKGYEVIEPRQHEILLSRRLEQVPGNFIPCLWTKPMVDFFNNVTVKGQLKIKPEALSNSWIACTYPGVNGFNYSYNASGSVWIYNELRGKGYRMLAYSGDTDAMIPTLGT